MRPDDREIHPRCGFEYARCACPKNVPSPLAGQEVAIKALASQVTAAIAKKKEAR